MSKSTAGKGPGLVLLAQNRSGVCRVGRSPCDDRALVEILEQGGRAIAEIGLNARELRDLAEALWQVADCLGSDEATTPSLQMSPTAPALRSIPFEIP
jgi:hypothetical protein